MHAVGQSVQLHNSNTWMTTLLGLCTQSQWVENNCLSVHADCLSKKILKATEEFTAGLGVTLTRVKKLTVN